MSERPKTPKRAVAVATSLAVHGGILAALIWGHREPPQTPEAPLMMVSVVEGISVAPAVTPPTPEPVPPTPVIKGSAAKPNTVRRTLPRPSAEPLAADDSKSPGAGAELTEAELAGAATAGSGAPGGTCDMARLLQTKLRRDPLVQAAVAGAGGKAIRVWNGEWVQSHGEDGKGLAAHRDDPSHASVHSTAP